VVQQRWRESVKFRSRPRKLQDEWARESGDVVERQFALYFVEQDLANHIKSFSSRIDNHSLSKVSLILVSVEDVVTVWTK